MKLTKQVWRKIRSRCNNPRDPKYKHYGGRGIKLHESWEDDYPAMRDYLGPKPSAEYSVDRIDNNGHYEPNNIKWSTPREQTLNRRSYLTTRKGRVIYNSTASTTESLDDLIQR